MIFAFSPTGGTGSQGQTSATGAFSIRVVSGSYLVGAFSPGVGKSKEVSVVVNSSGVLWMDQLRVYRRFWNKSIYVKDGKTKL